MEEKKITAVEWLVNEIESLITIETFQNWKALKKQAKEIEQDQLDKAYRDGLEYGCKCN